MNTPPPERPRRPGRPAQPIETDTLLAIARRAFATSGYEATSLGQIAARAGLRKASLYHHFPAKEALYDAVLQQLVGDLKALIGRAELDAGPFVERLDRLGALIIEYFAGHPDAAKLLVYELIGGGEYMRGRGADEVQRTLHLTAAFLQAGMEAGVFRQQDPAHLALTIVGLHLYPFATSEVSSAFLGAGLFTPATLQARKTAVLQHVRALCVAPGA